VNRAKNRYQDIVACKLIIVFLTQQKKKITILRKKLTRKICLIRKKESINFTLRCLALFFLFYIQIIS